MCIACMYVIRAVVYDACRHTAHSQVHTREIGNMVGWEQIPYIIKIHTQCKDVYV